MDSQSCSVCQANQIFFFKPRTRKKRDIAFKVWDFRNSDYLDVVNVKLGVTNATPNSYICKSDTKKVKQNKQTKSFAFLNRLKEQ